MISTELDSFFQNLEQSNLLAAEELAAVKAGIDPELSDPKRLARRLVESGRLTAWQASHLLSGQTAFYLGKYRLLEWISAGGMGTVIKAEHATLGRTVALKMLSRDLLKDPDAVARFRREIEAVAALDHPNVVRAFDADEVAGAHFLVMEHVEGVSLADLVKQHSRLSIDVACECIRQAALGLEHAHRRGMVHRDIKPANLVVSRPKNGGGIAAPTTSGPSSSSAAVVKILDMGLARLTSESGDGAHITKTGQVMGTVDFMAPEQARDTHLADIRSDIYALGATLFRLLTGRAIFDKGGPMQKLMARQSNSAPTVRQFRPEAPEELEAVVAKMLHRDPAGRYQTPGEVAAALEPFCGPSAWQDGDEPTLANVPPAGEHGQVTATLAQSRLGELIEETVLVPGERGETKQPTDPLATDDEESGMQQFLGALTHEAAREESALSALQRRDRARRRRQLRITAVLAMLAVPLVAGWWYLATHRGKLVLELPAGSREKASFFVNDRQKRLAAGREVEGHDDRHAFELRAGTHSVRLHWPGYKKLQQTVTITRGGTVTLLVAERLEPTAATARRLALRALQKRIEGGTQGQALRMPDDPTLAALRRDLVAFRRRNYQSLEDCITAARLMRRLPWPVDQLKREDIDPYELQVAGRGDPAEAPEGLVAVFGDSRLKHWGGVSSVAFSPDGKTLASASGDHTIKLWDPTTGKETGTLRGHEGWVLSVAFSPDGKRLASGSRDQTIKFWDASTGKQLRTLHGHEGGISSVAYSPDGETLASAGSDATIKLWDANNGEERRALRGHTKPVRSVTFSPDGKTIASGSNDATIKLWEADTGQELRTLNGQAGPVTCVAFSPDAEMIASACSPATLKLWDVNTGKEEHTLSRHMKLYSVAFSPDGQTLASGDHGRIRLWDPATGEQLQAFRGHQLITSVAISPDGTMLASAGRDNSIMLYNPADGEELLDLKGHPARLTSVAIDPRGKTIASASTRMVLTRNAADGQQQDSFQGRGRLIAFSPDGQILASANGDRIALWELKAGRQLRHLSGHTDEVLCVAFSPDGKTLASGANWHDTTVKLWDTATGRQRHTLSGHTGQIHFVAFRPDGKTLASSSYDGTFKLWNPGTGKEFDSRRFGGKVYCVAYSPDGKTLVTAHAREITLWNAATRHKLRSLSRHTDFVYSVTFSPDGKRLASSGADGTVRLWDVPSGDDLKVFPLAPPAGQIAQVAFTPDGRHLVTANGNGTAYVLRLAWPGEGRGSDTSP